jgi:predicted ArsR family transcriptional regulator
MGSAANSETAIKDLAIPLERDRFLCMLVRELAGTLQEVVGLEETAGLISIVGQRIGDQINESYRRALGVARLARAQVAEVLVDLERRIQGDLYVIEQTDEKLVLGNRACPPGERAIDRPTLCMIISNIFGVIVAENLGYAKVVLEETIAQGAPGCRVVIYLRPTAEAEAVQGREYFQG